MNRLQQNACDYLRSVDPTIGKIFEKIGRVRLEPRRLEPCESLIHSVIHQQLSGKAAATILGRFKAMFPNSGFPSPEEILKAEIAKLRSAGLSRAKASYVKNIAQHASSELLPSLADCRKLTDTEIIHRLTQIKGVGRWTAEMFLIFNLGRPDVLPIHDLGVKKGFQIAYRKRRLPEPEELERYGLKWRPCRTTAALYLWRTADFLRDGEW